jgi:hypothetical protein
MRKSRQNLEDDARRKASRDALRTGEPRPRTAVASHESDRCEKRAALPDVQTSGRRIASPEPEEESDMTCQHDGCRCQEVHVEREGRRFCSETCAEKESSGEHGNCSCGHPDCAAV